MNANIQSIIKFFWAIFGVISSLMLGGLLANWFPGDISPAGAVVAILGGMVLYCGILVFLSLKLNELLVRLAQDKQVAQVACPYFSTCRKRRSCCYARTGKKVF